MVERKGLFDGGGGGEEEGGGGVDSLTAERKGLDDGGALVDDDRGAAPSICWLTVERKGLFDGGGAPSAVDEDCSDVAACKNGFRLRPPLILTGPPLPPLTLLAASLPAGEHVCVNTVHQTTFRRSCTTLLWRKLSAPALR